MKTKNVLALAALSSCILLACTKNNIANINTVDQETTFELSTGQAVADNIAEDANSVFMEAAASRNLMGNNSQTILTTNSVSCANISVTPANGFPKTITVDFGNGCTATNGTVRKGKLIVTLSDLVRKTGSTAQITFDNYFVNKFKKEGSITWINTSNATAKGWQRKVTDGKITAPDGKFWLHSGMRDAVQIAGAATPNTLLDDVFLITGNHTVTNAAGKTRNCFITAALEKKLACENISTGKLRVEGANQTAVIDFGNGDCDKLATVTVNGSSPRIITLR